MKLTEELAYMLGALRDGCFIRNETNHIYRIRIYQKNREWIVFLSSIIERLFKKKLTVVIDNRDNVWSLFVNSKKIFERLVEISNFPKKQREWNTPEMILYSTKQIQRMYIKGFFDSEGGVPHIEKGYILPKNIRIHFTQMNKKCLEELKEMINDLNIKAGRVCGPYYKKGFEFPIYRLKIHGIKEVSKFADIIGSNHPEKMKRLSMISKLNANKA